MEELDDLDQLEFPDMKIEALIDLREQLINIMNPKTDFSSRLLETVDTALDKLINEQIINKK